MSNTRTDRLKTAPTSVPDDPDDPDGPVRRRVGQWRMGLRFIGMLVICSAGIELLAELLNRAGTETGLMTWIAHRPGMVLLNLAIVLSGVALVSFLANSLDGGCQIAGILFLAPAVAHYLKRRWLGQPLVPSDVGLLREVAELIPRMCSPGLAIAGALVGIGVLVVLGAGLRAITAMRFSRSSRTIAALAMILTPAIVLLQPPASMYVTPPPGSVAGTAVPIGRYYEENGFAASFFTMFHRSGPTQPEGYSDAAVQTALREFSRRAANPAVHAAVQPDVVLILSESFWDATRLPGVRYSEDPIPRFHALQKQRPHPDFLSPVFGGLTANAEFEVLTGMSMSFVPEGEVPYAKYIRDTFPSIAWVFKSQGYSTVALHANTPLFWERNRVLPLLGFDQFHGSEVFSPSDLVGPYFSDRALTLRIRQELTAAERPLFLFAISMENHGPFYHKGFKSLDVKVTSPMSPADKELVETLCQGLKDADQSLGMLVDFLAERKKPTILIFFGDHLPVLGADYGVFRRTGFVAGDTSAQDRLRLHTTPVLVWANFPCKFNETAGAMSPQMIWPGVLSAAGIGHPFYTGLLPRVASRQLGVSRMVSLDANGQLMSPSGQVDPVLHDYELIEYDLLFGRRHGFAELFPEVPQR